MKPLDKLIRIVVIVQMLIILYLLNESSTVKKQMIDSATTVARSTVKFEAMKERTHVMKDRISELEYSLAFCEKTLSESRQYCER